MMLHPTHAIRDSQNGIGLNNQTINLGLVALLHVAMVLCIAYAIAPSVLPTHPGSIETRVYDKVLPQNPIDLPKPVLVDPLPVSAIAPVIVIGPDAAGGGGGITVSPPQLPVVTPVPDTGPRAANARTIPPYPALAARLGQEGVVVLKLSISETGLVTGADIVKSSGFAVLDKAAIEWVQAHWAYKPATRAGQAVASSTQASLTFSLTDRR